MNDDDSELISFTSASLLALLKNANLYLPISSMGLLARIIALGSPPNFPVNDADTSRPKFRLTDLSRFESILETLSKSWDAGAISLLRDDRGMAIMDLSADPEHHAGPNSRKRKRVEDEDADSAAGDQEEIVEKSGNPVATTIGGMSKDMREVYEILQRGTAKGRLLAEQHRSSGGSFEPICPHITKDECARSRRVSPPSSSSTSSPSPICDRIHFRALMRPHTDPSLGHCSYLNTCYSEPTYAQSPSIPPLPSARGPTAGGMGMNLNLNSGVSLPSGLGAGGRGKEKAPCRYLHFEVDWDGGDGAGSGVAEGWAKRKEKRKEVHKLGIGLGPRGKETQLLPPQWINCDLRRFDYSVLGKFHVIMADPPWDIHMSLPYGTMTDDEMRAMPIPMLQDEGFIFLWVTGRAMEVGRECLRVWGYTRVDEVVWVKTNQLQRVIRTGRTGHWLNHTKEHMLVGLKTPPLPPDADPATPHPLVFPRWANRGLDTDVIVSEVRETSRKPDEVYGLIERICPGGRKIEIFGRKHNTRPGWLTLGNQLGNDQIHEEDLAARIKSRYPERMVGAPMQS